MSFMSLAENLERVLKVPGHAEVRERLEQKLEDYRRRIQRYTEEYRVERYGLVVDKDHRLLDSVYKATLLEELLDKGAVRVGDVYERLQEELKDFASDKAFLNAVNVLDDYLRTGGRHTSGGSGFFTEDLFTQLMHRAEVIHYPRDAAARAALNRKYHEYLGRTLDYESSPDNTLDRAAMKCDTYKLRILGEARDRGLVSLPELAQAVRGEEGRGFDRLEFYRAATRVKELCGHPTDTPEAAAAD